MSQAETAEAVLPEQAQRLLDAFGKKEDLNPELQEYYRGDAPFPRIQHPLVYSILHSEMLNGFVNLQYRQKKVRLEEAERAGDFEQVIFLHERPWRASVLFEKFSTVTPRTKAWEVAGSVWVDSENIWQNLSVWKALFAGDSAGSEAMMNPAERKELKVLQRKETVTVYRGANRKNRDGLSWTLSKEKAGWFARRFGKSGTVISREVPTSSIRLYFTNRGEQEVIAVHGYSFLRDGRKV